MTVSRCRFCNRTEGPFETTEGRVGVRRGSTSYRMRTYYHHAGCAAEFEQRNEALRRRERAQRETRTAWLCGIYWVPTQEGVIE